MVKSRSLLICLAAYAAAAVAAVAVCRLTAGLSPVWSAGLADLAATVVVFAFSLALNNSSMYDPYWSVAPALITAWWLTQFGGVTGATAVRQVLVTALVLVWAARLTWNWLRRWNGLADEDWRYADYRRLGAGYWPVSFLGFHLMPTVLVFIACLSLVPALSSASRAFGVLDVLAILVTAAAIAVEAGADRQLRRFLTSPRKPGQILDTGLWALLAPPELLRRGAVLVGSVAVRPGGRPVALVDHRGPGRSDGAVPGDQRAHDGQAHARASPGVRGAHHQEIGIPSLEKERDMSTSIDRFLRGPVADLLKRPLAVIQPVLARKGKPTVDLDRLAKEVDGIARVLPVIEVQSPEHWAQAVGSLGDEVDAIFPVSVPAYPTEIWNAHPEPLVRRGIPVVFWPLMEYDEPDFWRWSARDMLSSLGIKVHLVASMAEGKALLKAFGTRRFLAESRMVVFGEQNFPWNALSAGHNLDAAAWARASTCCPFPPSATAIPVSPTMT